MPLDEPIARRRGQSTSWHVRAVLSREMADWLDTAGDLTLPARALAEWVSRDSRAVSTALVERLVYLPREQYEAIRVLLGREAPFALEVALRDWRRRHRSSGHRSSGHRSSGHRSSGRRVVPACAFPACARRHTAGGLCYTHYQQRRRGLPLTEPRKYMKSDRSTP